MSSNPLVTYALFCYNQENFILDAVQSALSQTYEPLEIIISDDCSTDRTVAIVEKEILEYRGPHKVILNKNKVNLGLTGNINCALEMAEGDFFVMAAGDDISTPERTERLVQRWQDKSSPVDLVCSFFEEIDSSGKPTGFVKKNTVFTPDRKLPVQRWVCGATGACAGYSRKLFDKYGPLDPDVVAEDWIFSFRAWLESGIACIETPLVKHRTHENCISVIHRNVKKNRDRNERRLIMKKAILGKIARVKEWRKAWLINGGSEKDQVVIQLKKWGELLRLEATAYSATRVKSLKLYLQALFQRGSLRVSAKILYRHVFRIY